MSFFIASSTPGFEPGHGQEELAAGDAAYRRLIIAAGPISW